MTHPDSAVAGLFDHEREATASDGGRQAPDWGGDDLFNAMPRRRRFDHPARAQRGADHVDRPARSERVADRFDRAPRADSAGRAAARPGDHLNRRWDTMEHPIQRPQRPPISADLRHRSPLELPDVTERTIPLPEVATAPVVEGRRTVTITGHPERVPARRRPAPSIDERLYGSNPERIAMYAFALGLLLIVIAFLSANA